MLITFDDKTTKDAYHACIRILKIDVRMDKSSLYSLHLYENSVRDPFHHIEASIKKHTTAKMCIISSYV